ncbi:CAMKK1_2 [Blepharisma stoltei]|uniref:Protein kinase domain-containing protein n=1 Tax=Blepharisma stoltei TaxID=1481888 RepID=A0AAU9K2N6_9CILI|nr:unnamed protein product [Blepharisma stoltei]
MSEEEVKHTVIETNEVVRGVDQDGNTMVNQYSIIKNLGEGAFGKVKLCKKGAELYAVKIYNKALLRKKRDYYRNEDGGMTVTNALQDVAKEIALMKKLNHVNVVSLYEVIDDEDRDKLYMIMDFCGKGAIMEWDADNETFYFPWNSSGVIREQQIRKFFRDMVCGLEYLHYHNIIHRDIKPQNILLTDEWNVKIGDFGQAHIFGESDVESRTLGTYQFFPPECCSPETEGFSGKSADIWALGLTLYAMIYKNLPYSAGDSLLSIFDAIQNFELTFDQTVEISPQLQNLLVRLLDKNPETRIKMYELLQDPWINMDCHPLLPTTEPIIAPTEEEITQAVKPIRAMVIAKLYGRKWKNQAKKKAENK